MESVDRFGPRVIGRGRRAIWLRVAGTVALLCVLLPGCTSGVGDGTPTQSTEPTFSFPVTSGPTAIPTETGVGTKPPTARPTQREPTSQEKARERAKQELADGLVAYNPPDSATVDNEFQLTVRVQRGTTPGSPFTDLPGPSAVVTGVLVGTYMVADLGGATFETTLIGPRKQQLIGDEAAEWVWKVRPQEAGPQTLVLTLNAELDGEPVGGTRVFRRELSVGVVAAEERSWSQRFFGWGGWEEVLVTVLAAAALGIWKKGAVVRRWLRLRTKRGAQPSPDPASPPDPTSPPPDQTSLPDPASPPPDPSSPKVAAKKPAGPPQS